MSEPQFLSFARDRGLPVSGVVHGDPGRLAQLGLLCPDGVDYDGNPLFHPFRIYPLHNTLSILTPRIAPTASLNSESLLKLTQLFIRHLPSTERIEALTRDWNNVVRLVVLLEPLYWPGIVETRHLPLCDEAEARRLLDTYRADVQVLVRSLDPSFWATVHKYLCLDANELDSNTHLYILLRASAWHERNLLRGGVSGALWIRHMAEVLRRAFEEVHDQPWPEEDKFRGYWPKGAREFVYGAERPLDDTLAAKPYIAHSFGLFTGSAVRWYVEGETEYYAALEIFPDIQRFGVELVNLHGGIGTGKNNTPLRLESMLREDQAHRRFSQVSLDGDVQAALRFIRTQLKKGNVVGKVTVHRPDFEFANFDLTELVEIAAKLDESYGYSGEQVRHAKWLGVEKMTVFQSQYRQVSMRKPESLKGEDWGRALSRYAIEKPLCPDGKSRPLWGNLRAAIHAWSVHYDLHQKNHRLDPETFELVGAKGHSQGRGSQPGARET